MKFYKVCKVCAERKPHDDFKKSVFSKDGRELKCIDCKNKKHFTFINGEKHKECSGCNILKPFKDYPELKNGRFGLNKKCKTCISKKNKKWFDKNPNYQKDRRAKNPEKHNKYTRNWRKKNKDKDLLTRKHYEARRKIKDPVYKLKCNVKNNIYMSFKNKGYKKNSKTANILKTSYEEFISYLEENSNKKITDNIQIDHILPISWAKSHNDVVALNHYRNFQLLSPEENVEKGDKPPTYNQYLRVFKKHPNKELIQKLYLDNT